MVPGLALNRGNARELGKTVRHRADEHELAFFREHQQKVLIVQEHKLAIAVASTLPLALTVGKIDAREDGAVKTECVALMDDEIVEVGLEASGCPALGYCPLA